LTVASAWRSFKENGVELPVPTVHVTARGCAPAVAQNHLTAKKKAAEVSG
jgi:hypothetical protein